MKPKTSLLPQDAALLRRTVTAQLSDDEHELFIRACQRSGLDPFSRHLYFTRNPFRIEATIDGFRFMAEQTAQYAGQVGPHWCGPDGAWKSVWTGTEPPHAARVGILRKDFRKPIWGKALFSEYDQGGEFWRQMPANQLAKCAEALGLRKAFPQQLAGLYTNDELRSAAASSDVRPSRLSVETQPGTRGAVLLQDRPVPLPLQEFLKDQRGIEAGYAFIAGELEHKLGDAGRKLFRDVWAQHRGVFKTREEARAATIRCWLEMWNHLEDQEGRAAA